MIVANLEKLLILVFLKVTDVGVLGRLYLDRPLLGPNLHCLVIVRMQRDVKEMKTNTVGQMTLI